jgi:hypothetical protein
MILAKIVSPPEPQSSLMNLDEKQRVALFQASIQNLQSIKA